jgi:hypothetical protein
MKPTRKLLRLLRRVFSGSPIPGDPFARVEMHFQRAKLLVRSYYLLSIYFAAATIPDLHATALSAGDWLLLWPVRWLDPSSALAAADVFALVWLLSSLAAFSWPGSRTCRLISAAALVEVAALANSLGGINHAFHAWLWTGVLLVFLPKMAHCPTRAARMAYLSVIAGCQTLLLAYYTMAGFQKFGAGGGAMWHGFAGNFSADSLLATVADRMLQTGTTPPLAHALLDNPWVAPLLFLPIIFIQVMAVLAAFRPRIQQAWGLAIIAFHVGTWLLMEILFVQHVALLALFLLASPFAPARFDPVATIGDIPVIGPLIAWPLRRRSRLEAELPPAE